MAPRHASSEPPFYVRVLIFNRTPGMPPKRRRAQPKRHSAGKSRMGLLHWAKRAVAELSKAGSDLEADPVHDLRVAIRRCRSMAEGLRTVDPAPWWKKFRALAKPLFSALGDLREHAGFAAVALPADRRRRSRAHKRCSGAHITRRRFEAGCARCSQRFQCQTMDETGAATRSARSQAAVRKPCLPASCAGALGGRSPPARHGDADSSRL